MTAASASSGCRKRRSPASYDLDGAFSSVNLKLLRDASEREVIQRLDALLDRYGGRAAHGRKDQTSHAWLDHELDMLNNMSRTLPPIFLLVAAFLVNLTLSRLVALEREQIGLLKALGYGNATIALHYVKFVIVLTATASSSAAPPEPGSAATSRDCSAISFIFRFSIFTKSPDLYAVAAALSLAAAVIGAIRAPARRREACHPRSQCSRPPRRASAACCRRWLVHATASSRSRR